MCKINYDKDMIVSSDRKEPGKQIYYKFIEYAVKKCDKFRLYIMDFKDEEYNPHECSVMKSLKPYFLKSEKFEVNEHDPNMEEYFYYYRCCDEVIPILKSASEGFYNWGRNNCSPEDLTFLLENNEIWYSSITHEYEFCFFMDKNEYDMFTKEVKGLEMINRYEIDFETMILYHEDPDKEVYNEAINYAGNKSNYFDLNIFTEAKDVYSNEKIEESLKKYDFISKLSPYEISCESKLLKNFPVEMVGFPKETLNGILLFGEYDIKNYDKNFVSKIEEDLICETKEDEEEFKNIKIAYKDIYCTVIKYKLNDQSMKIIKDAPKNMSYWGHENKMPDVVRFYKDDIKNTWLLICKNDGFKASYVRFEKYGELVKYHNRTENKGEWYRV